MLLHLNLHREEVVAHPALGNVGGDAPLVGVEPFRMPGAAASFQAADVGADKRFGVTADVLNSLTRPLQMRARAVDARLVGFGNPDSIKMRHALGHEAEVL